MAAFMAISAGAAQAEPGSEWDVNGHNLSFYGPPALEPEVKGELENELGKLLTTINGLHIEVDCKEGTLTGVSLTPNSNGSTTEGDVKFSKCEVFKALPTLEALGECEVRSEDQEVGSGVILSLPGKALLALHELGGVKKPVTEIIPTNVDANGHRIFAHLVFEEEEEACGVLPEKVLIGGKLVVEDCENEAEVEKVTHLIVEEPELSELWAFNLEHPATLDGSALVRLAGAHTGLPWAALPN